MRQLFPDGPLLQNRDFEVALLAQYRHVDVERTPLEEEVDAAERQLDVQQTHEREEGRQTGAIDRQHAMIRVDAQTHARLNQLKDDARCPRLRRAGDGVQRRSLARTAMESAEQLRQPVRIHRLACLEESRKRDRDEVVEAVAAQTGRDQTVV